MARRAERKDGVQALTGELHRQGIELRNQSLGVPILF